MCGRFTLTDPAEAIARLFDARPANDLPEGPRYNICPTQQVAVVVSDRMSADGHSTDGAAEDGQADDGHATDATAPDRVREGAHERTRDGSGRRLVAMRWGFLPRWYRTPTDGPLLINARADTIAVKPAFRDAARQRRCLIPASGFYEWSAGRDGARLPWYITAAGGGSLALAGIWQSWTQGDQTLATCALVTTEAGDGMTHIHHREPVTVAAPDWPLWLGEAGHGAARLMHPAPAGRLMAYRVGQAVNSNRAAGPELIAPLDGP